MKSSQRGTLAYAAPERMGFSPYTEKVDMWAAGIVLYMLLVGRHPFEEGEEGFAGEGDNRDLIEKMVRKIGEGE